MTPAVSHLHTSQVIRLWCILSHRWTEEMTGNMDRWINAGQKGIGDKLFTCCQSMIQFTIRQKDSQQQKKQEMFLLLKRNRSERWYEEKDQERGREMIQVWALSINSEGYGDQQWEMTSCEKVTRMSRAETGGGSYITWERDKEDNERLDSNTVNPNRTTNL